MKVNWHRTHAKTPTQHSRLHLTPTNPALLSHFPCTTEKRRREEKAFSLRTFSGLGWPFLSPLLCQLSMAPYYIPHAHARDPPVTGSTASFLTPTWGGEQFPDVLFRGNLKISESGSQRCSHDTYSQATPSGNLPEQGKPYSC